MTTKHSPVIVTTPLYSDRIISDRLYVDTNNGRVSWVPIWQQCQRCDDDKTLMSILHTENTFLRASYSALFGVSMTGVMAGARACVALLCIL